MFQISAAIDRIWFLSACFFLLQRSKQNILVLVAVSLDRYTRRRQTSIEKKSSQRLNQRFLSSNRRCNQEKGREQRRHKHINKKIRLNIQSWSLQKELSSLTVNVSSIDPVVNEVDLNGDGCCKNGSRRDSDC